MQAKARQDRVELIEKRNSLLYAQLIKQNSGGIRDINTNRTVVKAKTLLTKQRIKDLDFEVISLKSPWVENPMIWNKIIKIWQNYSKIFKDLE
jgi:hypothetical protein